MERQTKTESECCSKKIWASVISGFSNLIGKAAVMVKQFSPMRKRKEKKKKKKKKKKKDKFAGILFSCSLLMAVE